MPTYEVQWRRLPRFAFAVIVMSPILVPLWCLECIGWVGSKCWDLSDWINHKAAPLIKWAFGPLD